MDPMELGPAFELLEPVAPTVDLTELTELVRQAVALLQKLDDSIVQLKGPLEFIIMLLMLLCGLVVGCTVGLILAGLLK